MDNVIIVKRNAYFLFPFYESGAGPFKAETNESIITEIR